MEATTITFIYGSDVYLNQYSVTVIFIPDKYITTLLYYYLYVFPLFQFVLRPHAMKTVK